MTITVDWDDEAKTLLRYRYIGKWTWDEYIAANEQAVRLARSVDHSIDVIADFSEAILLPDKALSGFKRSMENSRYTFGVAVIVSRSELVRRLVDLFQR